MLKREVVAFVLFIVFAIGCNVGVLMYDVSAQTIPTHSAKDPNHWYDGFCCSLRDCEPAAVNDVEVTPLGYTVRSHWIPFTDDRIKKTKDPSDTRYHICEDPNTHKLICLYIPASGF